MQREKCKRRSAKGGVQEECERRSAKGVVQGEVLKVECEVECSPEKEPFDTPKHARWPTATCGSINRIAYGKGPLLALEGRGNVNDEPNLISQCAIKRPRKCDTKSLQNLDRKRPENHEQ